MCMRAVVQLSVQWIPSRWVSALLYSCTISLGICFTLFVHTEYQARTKKNEIKESRAFSTILLIIQCELNLECTTKDMQMRAIHPTPYQSQTSITSKNQRQQMHKHRTVLVSFFTSPPTPLSCLRQQLQLPWVPHRRPSIMVNQKLVVWQPRR